MFEHDTQTFVFEHYMDLPDPSVKEPVLGTSLVAEISRAPHENRRSGTPASSEPGVVMEAGGWPSSPGHLAVYAVLVLYCFCVFVFHFYLQSTG